MKPAAVTRAVALLCISLAIGFVGLFWLWFHHHPLEDGIFTVLIMTSLVYKINQGRNWARITFLVIWILGVARSIPLLLPMSHSFIGGGLFFVQTALQTGALVMLFSRDARSWFRPAINPPATPKQSPAPN
jgi:hypothetical protein